MGPSVLGVQLPWHAAAMQTLAKVQPLRVSNRRSGLWGAGGC